MGVISSLFQMSKLARDTSDVLNTNPDDIKTVASFFQKAKSISAQAKKYVLEYPVACTGKISDYKTALAIAKQVEFDCARFIILASGLNPVIDTRRGDTIERHIDALTTSFESYTGLHVSITPASEDAIRSAENYMNNVYSNKEYVSFENVYSKEVKQVDVDDAMDEAMDPEAVVTDVEEKLANTPDSEVNLNEYEAKTMAQIKCELQGKISEDSKKIGAYPQFSTIIDPPNPSDDNYKEKLEIWNKLKDQYETKQYEYQEVRFDQVKANNKILDGLGKVKPTIIELNLYLTDGHGGQRAVSIPLAIKSDIQFIESIEIKRLLENIDNPGKKLQTFIKLTTGQMSFFKEFLFELEKAKSDVEQEKSMGNMPIYRRLINAKNRYRSKTIFGAIKSLKDFIFRKNQKDLPMCTIIMTIDELTSVNKQDFAFLIRNKTYINNIIDTFMLLGLGIIDETADLIYFFYSGEDEPTIINISDVGSGTSDANTNKKLTEVLSNMSKLMVRR